MSNNEGVLWVGVDLVVFSILGGEDVHSESVFFLSSVVEREVGNVIHESRLDSTFDILGGARDSGGAESSADSVKHFLFNLLIIKILNLKKSLHINVKN